jgi:hypothetical protein
MITKVPVLIDIGGPSGGREEFLPHLQNLSYEVMKGVSFEKEKRQYSYIVLKIQGNGYVSPEKILKKEVESVISKYLVSQKMKQSRVIDIPFEKKEKDIPSVNSTDSLFFAKILKEISPVQRNFTYTFGFNLNSNKEIILQYSDGFFLAGNRNVVNRDELPNLVIVKIFQ